MAQVEGFWRQLGLNPAGQQPLTPASPAAPMPAQPATCVTSAVPAPPPFPDDHTSWISQLQQLAQLHNQGVLSDAAYAAAKERILKQEKQPQPPHHQPLMPYTPRKGSSALADPGNCVIHRQYRLRDPSLGLDRALAFRN
jgi:hypothetical protein